MAAKKKTPAKKTAKKTPAKKAPAKKTAKKAPAKKAAAPAAARRPPSLAAKYAEILQKKFGDSVAMTLKAERNAAEVLEHIPTGVEVLDHYVLGNGGLPVGRMSEWFGDEGCGKTTLAYSAAASAQKQDTTVAWIDGEFSYDPARAAVFGVNNDELLIIQPEHLEEMFNAIRMLVSTHNPAHGKLLLILDSIAAMTTDAALRKSAGERKVGDVPLIMSEELKKLMPLLVHHRAHFMAINQVRANIGVLFGDKTTTPGGKAPKFYASQRVQIFAGKSTKNAKGEHIAKTSTFLGVKNRLNFPFLKAKVRLDYRTGYNNIWSTIWHAKRMKLIKCRAEGFSGPSREGLDAYCEALEALGWPYPPNLVDLGRTSNDVVEEADGVDDEEEEDMDDDEGED